MKYVAMLRGINVGGNKKVEMAKLRQVFESLGLENVSTYINSGNVIFEKGGSLGKLVEKTEAALKKTFGFEIKTVIRSSDNIKKLCNEIPVDWENNNEQKTDVLFLYDQYDSEDSLGLIKAKDGVDVLKYIDGAIAWNIDRSKYGKSGMNKFIGTLIYKNMTARNINTVRKLAELMG